MASSDKNNKEILLIIGDNGGIGLESCAPAFVRDH
jgi:hypothetical protein